MGRGLGHRLDRLRLRRIIEQEAPDDQQDEIEAAVLDAVDTTTEAEFGDMLSEATQP